MKPNIKFLKQPKPFWAYVRTISQGLGYTDRKTKQIKVPTIAEIKKVFDVLQLSSEELVNEQAILTDFGEILFAYFRYRADMLNTFVEPRLMEVAQAKALFDELKMRLSPTCPLPLNKQKGEKKEFAFFTGIINMLIEANIQGFGCNYNPNALTTVTRKGLPLRTLARRVDGAFPDIVNPIAVWEIKEYYHTKTFGSRVADGVYESLLDGLELEELREHENIDVKHYLMIDDHYTWWECGRSYLCRIIDMLHMGYADEVLFGYEVVEELPRIVQDWVRLAQSKEL